jgi:diadenylate cyclase
MAQHSIPLRVSDRQKGYQSFGDLHGVSQSFCFLCVTFFLPLIKRSCFCHFGAGYLSTYIFQPEIRQFLLLIGTPRFLVNMRRRFGFLKFKTKMIFILDVDPIVSACRKMSVTKTGALIVIARLNELQQYTESGQVIDAAISEDLILNLFFKNSPLHDGAVIVLNNRIRSARVILPVSGNQNLPGEIGLRHRAALGITEKTDAVAIVVSEEAGYISCFQRGNVKLNITPSQLKNFLDSEFNLEEKTEK